MPTRDDERDERRELARRVLRDSTRGVEPSMENLLASVPALVDEARRRRAGAATDDPIAVLVPLARRALPRLAAAAAVLLLVSAGFYVKEVGLETGGVEETTGGVESLLLTGTWSGEDGDPLLGAILGQEGGEENGNG
jgi:hypothetical protein